MRRHAWLIPAFLSFMLGGFIASGLAFYWATEPPVRYTESSWIDGTEICIGDSHPLTLHFKVHREGPAMVVSDWHRPADQGGDSIPGTATVTILNALTGTSGDPDVSITPPAVLGPGEYIRMTTVVSMNGLSRAAVRKEVVNVVDCNVK